MPLAFATVNRGIIPFGFFNARSDMLLLAEYFLFADAACGCIEQLAARREPPADGSAAVGGATTGADLGAAGRFEVRVPAWIITDRERLGDFHGAMAGTELWGFFGSVYRRFPFPERPEDFHQDPEGWRTQDHMRVRAEEWAQPVELVVATDAAAQTIDLGGYRFDPAGFAALVLYLWRGGAPRWMGGIRPAYVERMMQTVRSADSWLFAGSRWPA
jgi:hypothetical protein